VLLLAGCLLAGAASAGDGVGSSPGDTKIRDSRGKFVPVPDEVPHVEGAYVDKRIRKDLIYIARHFKVLVVEGFAGRLPSGVKVGCPKCHVSNSEHKIGLAVDIVPFVRERGVPSGAEVAARLRPGRGFDARGGCDSSWRGVSRLA
jgi:hypothetical protein